MPSYTFKPWPEMIWTLVILILGAALAYFQTTDMVALANPGAWVPGLIMAIARPVLGLIFDMLNGHSS